MNGSTRRATSSSAVAALLLLIVFAVNFLLMPRQLWPGDPQAWRQEARSLLLHHRFWVDPAAATTFGEPGQYYVFNSRDGHWYSKYGVMNAVMSLPPLAVIWALHGDVPSHLTRIDVLVLNLYNILLSELLCLTLYLISGRYSTRPAVRGAYVLACLYATYLWYYQRAQGSEIYLALFFSVAFYFLMKYLDALGQSPVAAPSMFYLLATWIFIAALALCRIFFVVLIPVIIAACIYVLFRKSKLNRWSRFWRQAPVLFFPPLLIAALILWIDAVKFGSPWLTGYHQWRPGDHTLSGSWREGIYGFLFSSHWSIFLYCPVLIFALFFWKQFFASHRLDALVILTTFAVALLVLGKIPIWRGEWTYGPRYMLFILPLASLPLLTLLENIATKPHRPSQLTWLLLIGIVLGSSAWLQFQVNRAHFWAFYILEAPLERYMPREVAEYLYDHHEGTIDYDLWIHRHDLDQSQLFRQLDKTGVDPPFRAKYKLTVEQCIDTTNFYWWAGGL